MDKTTLTKICEDVVKGVGANVTFTEIKTRKKIFDMKFHGGGETWADNFDALGILSHKLSRVVDGVYVEKLTTDSSHKEFDIIFSVQI